MDKITELKQLRFKLFQDNTKILDKAETEKRKLDSIEQDEYSKRDAEIDNINFQIEQREKLERVGSAVEEFRAIKPEIETANANIDKLDTPEYRNAYKSFLRGTAGETRAMSILSAADGGVLVPTTLYNKIVSILLDQNFMRQISTVISISNPINLAQQTGFSQAHWEGSGYTFADTNDTFKSPILNFTPKKITALVKVDETLIQDSAFDLEAYVTNNLAKSFAREEETGLINGSGTGYPTGILTACTNTQTTASTSAFDFDDLLELEAKIKPVYRKNACFLMNDTTAKGYRKIKDTLGRYIWTPSVDKAAPDQLMGYPVYRAWAMPAYTSANKPVIFGDMSYYYITQRINLVMQRLVELYSISSEVGYRAYLREDANLTNTEAVAALVVKS